MESGTTARHDRDSVAIALSGGGSRAALFSLGVMLALVDSGVNRSVSQIASVSGGTITNAFVAKLGDFSLITANEMTEEAARLADVLKRGILSRTWVALHLFGAVLLSIWVGGLFGSVMDWRGGVAASMVAFLSIALFVGRAIDRRIDSQVLNRGVPIKHRGTRLGSLDPSNVEHVFCATDLASGLPVYFSTSKGGVLWRRTSRSWLGTEDGGVGVTSDSSSASLARVCRASAAFPGLPAWRLSVHDRDSNQKRPKERHKSRRILLLADGGIANNLGTQVIREDRFFRGETHFEEGELPIPLIVVNASSRSRATLPLSFTLPGLAYVATFISTARILLDNSVGPRLVRLQESMTIDLDERAKPWSWYVLRPEVNLICDLHEAPSELEWRLSLGLREVEGAVHAEAAGHDQLIKNSPEWAALARYCESARVIRTTLGPVQPDCAGWAIARGYYSAARWAARISSDERKGAFHEPSNLFSVLGSIGVRIDTETVPDS